jgi:uncharacterized protein (UPF0297 family)
MQQTPHILSGRRQIYNYLKERHGVGGGAQPFPLELHYGLPVKFIGAKPYSTEESIDEWVVTMFAKDLPTLFPVKRPTIEERIEKFEQNIAKKSEEFKKKRKKDKKRAEVILNNFYPVRDKKGVVEIRKIINYLISKGFNPKEIKHVYKSIAKVIMRECGKKLTHERFLPILCDIDKPTPKYGRK